MGYEDEKAFRGQKRARARYSSLFLLHKNYAIQLLLLLQFSSSATTINAQEGKSVYGAQARRVKMLLLSRDEDSAAASEPKMSDLQSRERAWQTSPSLHFGIKSEYKQCNSSSSPSPCSEKCQFLWIRMRVHSKCVACVQEVRHSFV